MLRKIFFTALALRWCYAILIFALLGDAGLQTVDSGTYLANAHDFAAQIRSGSLSGLQWLAPVGNAMPLSQWLFGSFALLFGASTALAFVLFQGVVDAGSCLLVYGLARTLNKNYAAPAGIAAAFNPTQIVLSGLVLTDTTFLFFCALFLFAAVEWLRAPIWRWAVLLGLALGAATMSRALAAPFAAVLLLFLFVTQLARSLISRRLIAQLVGAGLIFSLSIAPVLWRNVTQFGAWSLTPQTGVYLALWVAPWVKEAVDGTPWARGYDEMQHRTDERYGPPTSDLFEQSRRYQTVGREELAALGIRATAKAWLVGAAINLWSPAIILSPPVAQLPRTGFYGTPGASPLDKIKNFLFHSDNSTYAWILLIGIAGVVAARFVQLIGVVVLLRDGGHVAALCLFGLWVGFVLAVDGPVASPKYRLPIEVPLMVAAGAGLSPLLRRRFAIAS
jgi:4-amino-4-deoxy-L-arabinose transferase-like glycosyltransferase